MASPVWLFLLSVLLGPGCLADVLSPCLGLKEIHPKRFANIKGRTIQLKLGTSNRLTHQLTTQVFAIFLTEVLGYNDVVIERITQTNITGLFSNLSMHGDSETSAYMIDLEVWIPPDLNIIHYLEMYNVKECGNIGPPGRFGWFVPASLVNKQKRKDILQWDIFSSSQSAKMYALLDQEFNYVSKFTRDNTTRKFYCNKPECIDGTFIPPQCLREACATLLATSSDEAGFVIDDIKNLNLFVRVIWVGDNLPWLVSLLTQRLQDDIRLLVFLGRTPGPLALSLNHTAINFPVCDPFDNLTVCSYSSLRMVKLAWSRLVDAATPAYESLQKVEFSVHDYRELIQTYMAANESESKIYDVACSWLNRHRDVKDENSWKHWMPSNDDRRLLIIGGIFPLQSGLYAATGIAISAKMAVDDVNSNTGILRDYKIELKLNDGQCQSDIVMKAFIDYILHQSKKLVGILGPACSETVEPLAGVSKHYNTVVISYSAEGSSFNDRKKYPYFFRTIGENKQYKYVYLELFRRLKWKRVASLTEDGTKYTEYVSLTQDLLQKNGIVFVANRKFPQDWEPSTFQQYLTEFKEKNARIIIADVNDDAAKAIMCQAYKMNMTARQGFVWFLPLWLSPWWEVNDKPSNHTNNNRTVDCTEEQIKEAINGHLSMSHAFFADDSWTTQNNETVGEWRKRYGQKVETLKNEPSIYAGYAYDAVWTYAYAFDALLKENASHVSSLRSDNTTKRFVEIIQNTNFSGVSGQIHFRDGPSRPITVNVFQWLAGVKYQVGTFYPNYTTGSKEISGGSYIETREIQWLNSDGLKPPWDGTPSNDCYIDGFARLLNTNCQVAIIVANIIGIGMLVLLLVISFLIIKHRYDKKVQLTQKYMKSLGIDLLSVSTMGSLDKWEIPKDRVVINRKLGEGAFGTVYGGEAYFDEKGWVAVAVKTLKVGSTTEEKLDFLSEAEVMKRFEHKNIVRLMGVCTKNEPVYTIMEFMLYGDLKTFLLARRHLVGERSSEDSDEISNKKLTSMALDVARALGYLAEMRYVHRDVASRNCLINANRTVKLGDFGMTRPTFENDYYKFNRKGMLPVRWMAPESLVLGVFTPASDVWSFGVLLYEIITFGNFPFQGMSNNQVLEYVKAGNTLTIPHGVKPQLEELIQKCWHKDYKKRPSAAEMVEFLANNPFLISPCIDVPLSSVQMEDAIHFDAPLALADVKTRKFPMTLRQRTPSTPITEVNLWREVATEPLLPTGRYVTNSSLIEEVVEHHHVDSLL